jgi:hypothetical protein
MTTLVETELLKWIGEEGLFNKPEKGEPVIPIRLLVMRLALLNNIPNDGLSKSTEMSLSSFEQIELLRLLRQLSRKNFITFFRTDGSELSEQEEKNLTSKAVMGAALGNIGLTSTGMAEVKRILGIPQTL